MCVLGGGDAAPPGQGPEARTPQPPSDSESESPKEVRPGVPGALLPQPEPRRPLPAPRASSPAPAAGSSMRCSAGAAAIPRAAAAAAAPLRPGGAAHPPSLPRTARRRSAPGPRPGHRPGSPQPSPRRMERRRRPHAAPPPPPPRTALRDLRSRRLSFSARRCRRRGRSGEGSELDPPRPPRAGGGEPAGRERAPGGSARRAGGAQPRACARTTTERARAGPVRRGGQGLPRARPAGRAPARWSPTVAWRWGPRAAASPPATGQTMERGGVGGPTGGTPPPHWGPSTVKSSAVCRLQQRHLTLSLRTLGPPD